MPIYEYECRKCGVFDYAHAMSARPLARCPRCRSKVTKLISASAFHLKGGGWYADGYDRKKAAENADTSGGTETKPSAEAKGEAAGAAIASPPAADNAPTPPAATPAGGGKKKGSKSVRSGKSAAA